MRMISKFTALKVSILQTMKISLLGKRSC